MTLRDHQSPAGGSGVQSLLGSYITFSSILPDTISSPSLRQKQPAHFTWTRTVTSATTALTLQGYYGHILTLHRLRSHDHCLLNSAATCESDHIDIDYGGIVDL